jgi:hypothetical protein
MSARQDPTRRDDLMFMLRHGGAFDDEIARRVVDNAIAEALAKQQSELENYERLNPQQCPKGIHSDWLIDSEHTHACPWCRIAELEAAAICPSVARLYGSKCVLPVRHRGDHRDETKRHYWSDEYAIPQQRSEA